MREKVIIGGEEWEWVDFCDVGGLQDGERVRYRHSYSEEWFGGSEDDRRIYCAEQNCYFAEHGEIGSYADFHWTEQQVLRRVGGANQSFRVIPEGHLQLVWRCPACLTEYRVGPEEATVPYCSNEDCPNREGETEYDRAEEVTGD